VLTKCVETCLNSENAGAARQPSLSLTVSRASGSALRALMERGALTGLPVVTVLRKAFLMAKSSAMAVKKTLLQQKTSKGIRISLIFHLTALDMNV